MGVGSSHNVIVSWYFVNETTGHFLAFFSSRWKRMWFVFGKIKKIVSLKKSDNFQTFNDLLKKVFFSTNSSQTGRWHNFVHRTAVDNWHFFITSVWASLIVTSPFSKYPRLKRIFFRKSGRIVAKRWRVRAKRQPERFKRFLQTRQDEIGVTERRRRVAR